MIAQIRVVNIERELNFAQDTIQEKAQRFICLHIYSLRAKENVKFYVLSYEAERGKEFHLTKAGQIQ
jgi:hypothetical protein